jgi:predicted aldo/keto reductase-like oxidoreductase
MKYRKLGRTGLKVSEIGMGLEYLLDKEERVVIDTIKTAFDGGVNYFDCHMGHDYKEDAVDYEGYAKLGKALAGIREKVCISHISHFMARDIEKARPRFESYLGALSTDHTDVFMIQFCDKIKDYEHLSGSGGLLSYAKKLKAEGKARSIGVSTHSSAIACRAIESGDFDVIMYPVNPAFDVLVDEGGYIEDDLGKLWDAAYGYNVDNAPNLPLIRKNVYTECQKNDIGLVAMKPFGGGFIFREDMNTGFTPLNLISYALTQNGVSTVVPGCQNPQQIEELLEYYSCAPEALDFSAAVSSSRWSIKGNCQYCNHCLPCPAGIDIGGINRIMDNNERAKYNKLELKASSCSKCGICEERCPFGVMVRDKMELAEKMFE